MFCYIYKLIHKDATNDDMVYIGSTCDVANRMKSHKKNCTNPNTKGHNYKLYKYIRENGGWEEWKYEILDEIEVPFKNDPKRFVYEGEYTRKYDAINKLNSEIAGRTKKEYRQDNKGKISESKKKYYENNKEKINEIICCNICGTFSIKRDLKRHQQSKKCINFPNK
jgi:hypothetical protein